MFKNKTVLITGGSSGIGKATALLFARNGANVVITYKENNKGAENVAREIKQIGGEAEKVVEETIKKFGKIDVLVNNAGRYIDGDEWNGSSDIWVKSLQQNLVSMMSVSKFVIEIFQQQKSGIMVNVASRHSINGQTDAISYAAAKAGVANITQAYAKLLTVFGGRANAVSPGAVNAGYWLSAPRDEVKAQGKLIEPETIAEKILFLASDDAKNINGQNILVTE